MKNNFWYNKKRPKHSKIMRGENHVGFKGFKMIQGYIAKYYPNHPYHCDAKYVYEHRLVVENYLGKFLTPNQPVHHINKIRNDNRIENLMAFTSNSAHLRFHGNPMNVTKEEILFDGRKLRSINEKER